MNELTKLQLDIFWSEWPANQDLKSLRYKKILWSWSERPNKARLFELIVK